MAEPRPSPPLPSTYALHTHRGRSPLPAWVAETNPGGRSAHVRRTGRLGRREVEEKKSKHRAASAKRAYGSCRIRITDQRGTGRWKVDPGPDSELERRAQRTARSGVGARSSFTAAPRQEPIYSGVGMIQLRVRVLRRLTVYNNLQQAGGHNVKLDVQQNPACSATFDCQYDSNTCVVHAACGSEYGCSRSVRISVVSIRRSQRKACRSLTKRRRGGRWGGGGT